MTSRLDSQFFEYVKHQDKENARYEAYKARYARSTMVLFSKKTRSPLAALIFHAQDPGVMSLLTGRPAPPGSTEPHFQGLLNMPEQVFRFTIANLSNEGFINFNILHTPHRVNEVDPGPAYGINEVNELRQNQAYTIPADQRTGRAMVLSGLTKINSAGQQVAVSVDESESKAEKKEGLYFYLSVVASNSSPSLVAKFAEGTVWKCTDHFVRKVNAPPVSSYRGGFGGDLGIPQSYRVFAPVPQETMYRSLSLERSGDALDELDSRSMLLSASAGRVQTKGIKKSARETSNKRGASDSFGDDEDDFVPESSAPPSAAACAFSMPMAINVPQAASVARGAFSSFDVGSTQAGRLSYGQQEVVRSGFTGLAYAYEHPSEPTVLCLSLFPDLKFLPLPDVTAEIDEEIKEWIENEGKALIEALTRIYKSDVCCIDLESECDTVICQCGHQCINRANTQGLAKCPLCRGNISAMVLASGLILG